MQWCLWSKCGKWSTIHWNIDKLKHLVFLKFVLLPCFRWNKFPKLASVVKCWSMTLATASYETSWDVMSCRHMWSTETSCMVTQRVSLPRLYTLEFCKEAKSWHIPDTETPHTVSFAPPGRHPFDRLRHPTAAMPRLQFDHHLPRLRSNPRGILAASSIEHLSHSISASLRE